MNAILFLSILFLTFLVFLLPKTYKYSFALFLLSSAVALSSVWSVKLLSGSQSVSELMIKLSVVKYSLVLTIDPLGPLDVISMVEWVELIETMIDFKL